MKNILILALCFTSLVATAQPDLFVAAKSGLSIRDKPDVKAAVIGKIPYGTKVTVSYPGEIVNINTEGIVGAWATVTHGGKTGYIVNSYLFPFPPPKTTIKTMKEYLGQISSVFGSKLVVKDGNRNNVEEGGYEIHKQLYKNGGEWHEIQGFEYGSMTYFLPEFTMSQGFLLVRMISEFEGIWTGNDEFPVKDQTIKKGEIEQEVKVVEEMIGDTPWIRRISIGYADGAIYNFEMFQLDNQLVIFISSGV